MHFLRFSAALALAFLFLLLWHCGVVAQFTFERQCKRIAGIEVRNPILWRQYLIERRRSLVRAKVTEDGREIDPTDRWPLVVTDHFTYATDWMLHRTPQNLKNKAFRNDAYISLISTGEPVARFRDLRLMYDTIETTMSIDCTSDYPELYTGSRPHRGAIMSVGR